MSQATPPKPTISEQVTAWTSAACAVLVTVSIGHWTAVQLQLELGPFYLVVIGTFVLSTLRVVTRPGARA